MKISKKKLTRLVKEAILKDKSTCKMLNEAMPKTVPADNAKVRLTMKTLQGAAEFQHAVKDFIQFIADFKQEQATLPALQVAIEAAVQELGLPDAEAAKTASVLKRVFQAINAQKGQRQDQGQKQDQGQGGPPKSEAERALEQGTGPDAMAGKDGELTAWAEMAAKSGAGNR